jgi:hypothetical protein
MAYPPTSLVISYGTSSTATVAIPSKSNYSDFVRAIYNAGGLWIPGNATPTASTQTFVPWAQITSIAAS